MYKTLSTFVLALFITGCAGLGRTREVPPYDPSKSLALNIALAAGITTPDGKLKDLPRAEWEKVKDQWAPEPPVPDPAPAKSSETGVGSLVGLGTGIALGMLSPAPGFGQAGSAAMNVLAFSVHGSPVEENPDNIPETAMHLVAWVPAGKDWEHVQAEVQAAVEKALAEASGLNLSPATEWFAPRLAPREDTRAYIQPGCQGTTDASGLRFRYDRRCSGAAAVRVARASRQSPPRFISGMDRVFGPIHIGWDIDGLLAAPNSPQEYESWAHRLSRALPDHFYLYLPKLKAVPILLHKGERLDFVF